MASLFLLAESMFPRPSSSSSLPLPHPPPSFTISALLLLPLWLHKEHSSEALKELMCAHKYIF